MGHGDCQNLLKKEKYWSSIRHNKTLKKGNLQCWYNQYWDFSNQVHLGYSMVFNENLNTHQPWTLIDKYYKCNVVHTSLDFWQLIWNFIMKTLQKIFLLIFCFIWYACPHYLGIILWKIIDRIDRFNISLLK